MSDKELVGPSPAVVIDGNNSQRSHKDKLPEIITDDNSIILTGRGQEHSKDLMGDFPVEYCNRENPDSVELKAPDEFVKMLDRDDVWKLLKHNDEFELQKKVKPTAEQNRLRLAFWREYERAVQLKEQMNSTNIYKGIMAKENFQHLLVKEPRVVAWILKQPTNYVNTMNEALDFSMHRMREILEMPLYKMEVRTVPKPDGSVKEMQKRVPNTQVAKLMLDVMKMLDVRVKGAVVQKVQQEVKTQSKSFHINANLNAEDIETLSDIDAQIAKLSR